MGKIMHKDVEYSGAYVEANPQGRPTAKLNSLQIGSSVFDTKGSEVTVIPFLYSGTAIAEILIDGKSYTLFAPEGGGGGGDEPVIQHFTDINTNWIFENFSNHFTFEIRSYMTPEGIELIPSMLEYNNPKGEATASSAVNSSTRAYKAFDYRSCNTNAENSWVAQTSDQAPWLRYTFEDGLTPKTLDKAYIETFTDRETTTRVAYIEGLTTGDVWENCLDSGNSIILSVEKNTWVHHNIALNGQDYVAIRIRGVEPWYVTSGGSESICISRMQVYTNYPSE